MSTEELIAKLKSLPQPELREALGRVGFVPAADLVKVESTTRSESVKGLTPGLLRGMVTHMADDFDAELPESFWSDEAAS